MSWSKKPGAFRSNWGIGGERRKGGKLSREWGEKHQGAMMEGWLRRGRGIVHGAATHILKQQQSIRTAEPDGGGGNGPPGGPRELCMLNTLPIFAPEAVAIDMDLFSSRKVNSAPRAATEGLPRSLQFCQTCIRWQMQELEHHKEACTLHYLSII